MSAHRPSHKPAGEDIAMIMEDESADRFLGLSFKGILRLAMGKRAQVIVLRARFHEPIGIDNGAATNVIRRGQHKLVVQNPFWLAV